MTGAVSQTLGDIVVVAMDYLLAEKVTGARSVAACGRRMYTRGYIQRHGGWRMAGGGRLDSQSCRKDEWMDRKAGPDLDVIIY
jgi:hypothetical protein